MSTTKLLATSGAVLRKSLAPASRLHRTRFSPSITPTLVNAQFNRAFSATPRSYSASVTTSPTTMQDIYLNPPNWDVRPQSERFEISPFGYMMPRIYVPMCEVFPLPEDTNREEIVSNLSRGLEATISRFPVLAGVLEHDSKNGCLWATTTKDRAVHLHVRNLSDELPSFKEMEANDFPSQAFSAQQVLPEYSQGRPYWFAAKNDPEDQAVAGFQVTFIKGGVIVSLSIHHHLSDATGLDAIFTEWARNSAAFAAGKTLDKTPFHYKVSGTSYEVPKPSPTKVKLLEQKHTELVNHKGYLDELDQPKFMSRLWHFPRTSLNELKKQVSATLPKSAWISTYDVMLAVLWSRIARARAPIRNASGDHEPVLTHAINSRGGLFPPMGNEHIACGTTITRVEPTPLNSLTEFNPVNIGKVALDIRESIRETRNCSWLHSEMQYVEGQADKRFVAVNINHFRDMDLCASSWRELSTYKTHDFGFGLPHALRMPDPQNEGYVFIYPSRAHLKPVGSNEGTEMVVLLDEGSQKRLMADEILLKYAHPRGI